MIIKDINAKKFSIQNNESIMIILKTDSGKYKSKIALDSDSLFTKEELKKDIDSINNILKDKIKKIEIKSYENLSIINEIIKTNNLSLNNKTILCLESSILKALSKDQFWKYLDPNIKEIPRPLGILLGSSEQKKSIDFKQILIFVSDTNNFNKAITANLRVHDFVEKEIKRYDKEFNGEINKQGAIIANISDFDSLDLISRICRQVSNELKVSIKIGINFNADNLYKDNNYCYSNYSSQERDKKLNKKEQIDFILNLIIKYDLFYIEDPLESSDLKGYSQLRKKTNILIVGNKLINNNLDQLNQLIKNKFLNAIVLKINKSNSFIDMKSIIETANTNNLRVIMETSDFETEDNFFVDFSVCFKVNVIKYGIYVKDKDKINQIGKIEKIMKEK